MDEPLPSSEAPRAPALDLRKGLATPTAGPDASIGSTAGMRGLATCGEQLALQDHLEQLLCTTNLFCQFTGVNENTVVPSFFAFFVIY